jgi:hypothetical protein
MTQKQQSHLDALSRKHKMLDEQIKEYEVNPSISDEVMHQLKKEKLAVKDEIFAFKRQLAKDILTQKV